MINDSDIIFNANEDLKAEQLVDLERCWDEYSTYPDGPVKAGWKDKPTEERQIQVDSTGSGYTNEYTSHFIYGNEWSTHYLTRNALVASSLISALAWFLVSVVCFIVVNVKYARPKEITNDKVI
jgi:hypothetical protein